MQGKRERAEFLSPKSKKRAAPTPFAPALFSLQKRAQSKERGHETGRKRSRNLWRLYHIKKHHSLYLALGVGIIGEISKAFSPELPSDLGTMDQHLGFILPKVAPYSDDLAETSFWLGKRWKEVREDEGFHEAILHIFNEGGEYLLSLDGNVVKGTWRQLAGSNTLILEMSGKGELFDLKFLNDDYLILSKHGDQDRKGLRRYFCLMHEPALQNKTSGGELDWRQAMEKLFNVWRENSLSLWVWTFLVGLLGLTLYLSL
mgnify:CR=1 FL=1